VQATDEFQRSLWRAIHAIWPSSRPSPACAKNVTRSTHLPWSAAEKNFRSSRRQRPVLNGSAPTIARILVHERVEDLGDDTQVIGPILELVFDPRGVAVQRVEPLRAHHGHFDSRPQILLKLLRRISRGPQRVRRARLHQNRGRRIQPPRPSAQHRDGLGNLPDQDAAFENFDLPQLQKIPRDPRPP